MTKPQHSTLSSIINFPTYNFPLLDIVEEDEVAEHGGEAEQPQARHDHDHRVLFKDGIGARGQCQQIDKIDLLDKTDNIFSKRFFPTEVEHACLEIELAGAAVNEQ